MTNSVTSCVASTRVIPSTTPGKKEVAHNFSVPLTASRNLCRTHMKEIQNSLTKLMRQSRIANITLLVVCLSCIFAFLISPLSPLHATSSAAAWNGNFVSYNVGDTVTYNGNTYVCIQAHTSEPNWDPADTADLWQLQTSGTVSESQVVEPQKNIITTDAASSTNGLTAVSVTFYTDIGLMADGNETHLGACAVWVTQFPFGTTFNLYYPDNLNQVAYSCTAEDTGTHICENDVDVALPGQDQVAVQLGVQSMLLQVTGLDQTVAQEAAANHATSQGCELGATH